MELLLMAVILHALFLHQGIQGAAISSDENGTDVSGRDKNQNTGGGPHTPGFSDTCSGSLMALHHGRWVTVMLRQQSNETKKNMVQHCNDFGSIFAENGTVPMNTCLSDCTIINSNLYICAKAEPDNCSNVIKVICAWQAVRLNGSNDRCAGRVELFGTGGWGSVCDDGWDMKAGDVVCAQLGCGTAVRVMGKGGKFPGGSGPIYFSQINCSGTERNLWQCKTKPDSVGNYCGHKEDAAVVCSGSSYILPHTSVPTVMPDLTNWTTETIIETTVTNDNSGGISAPVLGCIVLSVALFLLLFTNATQCAYYKRRQGRIEGTMASHVAQQDNSDTSSDSDYEHYVDHPPSAVNNCEHNDTLRVGDCHQEEGRLSEETNAKQTLDQFYPGYCVQMTPLHHSSQPAQRDTTDSFDSDSTSSGECYENTEENAKLCLQTLEGNPSLPELPPLSHPIPQESRNSSVSQPHSANQAHALDSESTSSGECYENTGTETENLINPAVNQIYPEHCVQMTPLHDFSEPAQRDAIDSDSTSSGECYENVEVDAESCLQTLEGNPSLPEQPLLSHPVPQMAGNNSVSQPYSPDQDDSSTSSEEAYENIPEIEENCCARREHSLHSSSDSDYDDVSNW